MIQPLPVVGVPACVKEINTLPFHTVNQRYLVTLAEVSHVMPLVVPALGERIDFGDLAQRLDGLLVTGSPSNVEPRHYGAERAKDDILHDPARDATTLPLIREALRIGLPVLAVCRGIQELNVVMGGTLHQFVHEVPGRMDHRSDKSRPIGERWRPSHTVRLVPDGYLARLLGEETLHVNSLHGQGIDRLGDGLVVEATADDGTIEAVRVEGAANFALGVQWHPEALCLECELSRRLFRAFGDAVRARAASRQPGRAAA